MDVQKKAVAEDSLLELSTEESFNDDANITKDLPTVHAEAIPRGDSDHASDDDVEIGMEKDGDDDDDDEAGESEDVSEREDLPAVAPQPKKVSGPASKTTQRRAVLKRQKKSTAQGTGQSQDADDDQSSEELPPNVPLTKKAPGPASKTRGSVAATKIIKTVSTKGGRRKPVVSNGIEKHSGDEEDVEDSEKTQKPQTKTSAKGRKPRVQKGKPKEDSNSESEVSKKSATADEEDAEDSELPQEPKTKTSAKGRKPRVLKGKPEVDSNSESEVAKKSATADEEDAEDSEVPQEPKTKTSGKGKNTGIQKGKSKVDSNSEPEVSKKSVATAKKAKVVATRTKGAQSKKPVRSESDEEPETVTKSKPKTAVNLDKPTTSKRGNTKVKESVPSGSKLKGLVSKKKPSKTESSGDEEEEHEPPIKKDTTKSTSRRAVKTLPNTNKSESDEEQKEEKPVEKRSNKGGTLKSKSRIALIKKRLSSTRLSIAMAVENKKRPSSKDMILAAVTALDTGRNPVSFSAMKKFIFETYQVSPSNNIKKAVLKAVENGELIQKTGTGASGSFKLAKIVKKETVTSKNRKAEEGPAKTSTKPKAASPTKSKKTSKKAN